MHLEETLLGLGMAQRISYDAERNTLFVNFEGLHVRTRDDVDRVRRDDRRPCAGDRPQGRADRQLRRLPARSGGLTPTFATIRYMEKHYYTTASRYTTSAFLRLKLGEALDDRARSARFRDAGRGPCAVYRPRASVGAPMPFLSRNGVSFRYEVTGQGPPLCLIIGYRLHGAALATRASSRGSERHFTVLTFDNRGTGLSDKPMSQAIAST